MVQCLSMSKPKGHGFEVCMVTPTTKKGVYQDPFPMVLFNGEPVGLVTDFKVAVDPKGETVQLSFSTRMGMNAFHGMTMNEFDRYIAKRKKQS